MDFVSAAPVSSARDEVITTCEAAPRLTRRERRTAARMRGGMVMLTAVRAALGGATPTTPRAVGRYVIHEPEGALGGAGFSGNARVCLTCQLERDVRSARGGDGGAVELYETKDPYDRAHAVTALSTDCQRMLLPTARSAWRRSNSGEMFRCAVAVQVPGAKPRRYPRSSMLASGVAIDSAFDWLWEARRRLAGVPGVGVDDESAFDVRAGLSELRLRDLIRRRVR